MDQFGPEFQPKDPNLAEKSQFQLSLLDPRTTFFKCTRKGPKQGQKSASGPISRPNSIFFTSIEVLLVFCSFVCIGFNVLVSFLIFIKNSIKAHQYIET
jgi:hypothetical protein